MAQDIAKIRNVAIVGHGGVGKTSLVESILLAAGATTRLGKVDDGTTATDFDPDEIPDPQALAVSLRVNGQTRQSSNTAKMIFPVAQCVEVLSQGMTLLPGDIIATGTPEGVGAATGTFLRAGDRIEAEVEGIGILASKVVRP